MYNRKLLVIVVLVAIAVVALFVVVLWVFPKGVQCGYTEIEGFLELRAYPKISDSVPTVMVHVVIPIEWEQEIYLTEDGMPLSSLEGFTENDLVTIEGVSYLRDAVDGSKTYWMLEVFKISEGD
jgi:hypothetical protein